MSFSRYVVVFLFSVWTGAAFAAGGSSATAPAYVGTAICSSCHEAQAAAWQTSDHAHAWMEPSETTVDGDFNDVTFTHKGKTSRFFRKDGDYYIETGDVPDGPKTFRVIGVDGIKPLQQYLVETEPGRVQSFDVVWDQVGKRWYHLYGENAPLPTDGLHWTGPYKTWNARCAECHATGFEKNYDARTRRYHSSQAEIGVGCEACHGPGEAHVSWANGPEAYAKNPFPGTGATGLLVDFSKGLQQTEVQQCAGCHSRREAFEDGNPVPGTPYHDAYRQALLSPGLYHADGQILDEVYVYGSFLQSKMYAKGVTCSNCHEPHSGMLKAEGNAVCTQCHSPAPNPAFPSLTAKLYDDPSHHFHEAGTKGAACMSCHMIERVYMGIDGRRDHSFRVPRPDLSAKIGTPNACTDCHADKSPEWAAAELERRFPDSTHRGPHFGEIFAGARAQPGQLGNKLLDLAKTSTLPGIVRASALDLLAARATPEIAARAAGLLQDEDPLVRAAAVAVQRAATPNDRLLRVAAVLEDPMKSVRIAAAREMLALPVQTMPLALQRVAKSATDEWQASIEAKLDFPESQMVFAGAALVLRNPRAALQAFGEASRLDPQLIGAWVMQVRILMAVGEQQAASQVLKAGLNANPGDPSLTALKQQLGG